jgi:hypothetical protein
MLVRTNTKGHTRNHWNASNRDPTLSVEATNIVVKIMHFCSYTHDRAQYMGMKSTELAPDSICKFLD